MMRFDCIAEAALSERIARIEMLVLDVDGVLTNGQIIYTDDNREIKAFHVRDGAALRFWIDAGKQVAIISGRKSLTVARRAAELGITRIVQGASSKLPALREVLADTGLHSNQVCMVGDDLPDWPLLRNCGLGIAVADACPELRAAAHWVTQSRGGYGAVREVIERLMQGQGLWLPLLERLQAEML